MPKKPAKTPRAVARLAKAIRKVPMYVPGPPASVEQIATLRRLVFRQAEDWWNDCAKMIERHPDTPYQRYVLIEETCNGKPIKSWIHDQNGLREISLQELQHHLSIQNSLGRIFPHVHFFFEVLDPGWRVEIGTQEANTAGIGGTHIVKGCGMHATLEPDPTGSFWRS